MIQVKDEYIKASAHIKKSYGFDEDYMSYVQFCSHDPKYLEKIVNEFLEDKIYISMAIQVEKVDTSARPEFSDKVELFRYYVRVYYQDWPF